MVLSLVDLISLAPSMRWGRRKGIIGCRAWSDSLRDVFIAAQRHQILVKTMHILHQADRLQIVTEDSVKQNSIGTMMYDDRKN